MRRANEVDSIDESLTLGERRRLQKAVAFKVYELDSELFAQRNRFKELYRELKNRFAVSSYKEINQKDLQIAIRFIEGWKPKNET